MESHNPKIKYWGLGNIFVNVVFATLFLFIGYGIITSNSNSFSDLIIRGTMFITFLYIGLWFLTSGVEVNIKDRKLVFHYFFHKKTITSKNITEWAIYKRPVFPKLPGSLVKYIPIFTCTFKNGEIFTYKGLLVWYFPYAKMLDLFSKALGMEGKDLGVKENRLILDTFRIP